MRFDEQAPAMRMLAAWMEEQPAEYTVEVQARLRSGARLDVLCIRSTSPIASSFIDVPDACALALEALMREQKLAQGDTLELTSKRPAHSRAITHSVTTAHARAAAADEAAVRERRQALSTQRFGSELASRVTASLDAGAIVGVQYDPRDGNARGMWRDALGRYCRGEVNVNQGDRYEEETFADASTFAAWLADQSDLSLYDRGFAMTRSQLERSASLGRITS